MLAGSVFASRFERLQQQRGSSERVTSSCPPPTHGGRSWLCGSVCGVRANRSTRSITIACSALPTRDRPHLVRLKSWMTSEPLQLTVRGVLFVIWSDACCCACVSTRVGWLMHDELTATVDANLPAAVDAAASPSQDAERFRNYLTGLARGAPCQLSRIEAQARAAPDLQRWARRGQARHSRPEAARLSSLGQRSGPNRVRTCRLASPAKWRSWQACSSATPRRPSCEQRGRSAQC